MYFRSDVIGEKQSKVPLPTASWGISRERFNPESCNCRAEARILHLPRREARPEGLGGFGLPVGSRGSAPVGGSGGLAAHFCNLVIAKFLKFLIQLVVSLVSDVSFWAADAIA